MKKAPKQPGPDDLVRQSAGSYLSGDGRFRVDQSDSTWYLVDTQQANEFGQELMHGPFPSLKAAKAATPGARDIKPLLRSVPRPKRVAARKAPPPPPPTWLDKLSSKEASEARALIRALERQGVLDADDLVRHDRDSPTPLIAIRLLQQRLNELLDDLPKDQREGAKKLVQRIAALFIDDGVTSRPLPGWALIETDADRQPTKRRIRQL